MSTIIDGADGEVQAIKNALDEYEHANEGAEATLYRQNSMSVRIRIIDPSFHGLDTPERHDRAWQYLGKLSDEIQGDITMLVLIAPDEETKSFANFIFEQRETSKL